VPSWSSENGCFSCHNNGDAARALMAAGKKGIALEAEALEDTLVWLSRPESWDRQQADAPYRDKSLARIQFSHALAEAVECGQIHGRRALVQAAGALAKLQTSDGSWPLEQDAAVGSPATYGTPLSTAVALRVLRSADAVGYRTKILSGEQFLARNQSTATVDRAAVLLALGDQDGKRKAALLSMQAGDGGWGPYKETPPEVFDTAIAVLALAPFSDCRGPVTRAVSWLVAAQLEPGGWPGTTRPSGSDSYAQHISTTGWALLALLKAQP
jgi:hypothetical protein